MLRDRSEWAEENFSSGRCPRCRARIYVESGCVAECSCGWGEDQRRPELAKARARELFAVQPKERNE